MAGTNHGTTTGVVVYAKSQRWDGGAKTLRVLVRTADGARSIGLVLGGDAYGPAVEALKAGRLAVGATVKVSGGTVTKSVTETLADGTTVKRREVRYPTSIKTVEAVEALPPLVRRVTQFR